MGESMFSAKEIEYLSQQRLGRLATSTPDGKPHAIPTGFRVVDGVVAIGGHKLAARQPLYLRNIVANPWVAYVVDDLASVSPWIVRGVTVRGRAEVVADGGQQVMGPGFDPLWIRITPTKIISWGL
jgi:pyridoxamine 5'-phosphate oxidase family protein